MQQSPQFRRALTRAGVETCDAPGGFVIRRRWPGIGDIGLWSRGHVRDADTLRALRRDGLRIVNAEGRCDEALRQAGFRQILTPAHIAQLDLTGDPRARMHQKWRNRLRRAEGAGLRIRTLCWNGSPHWLFRHEAAQRRQRGYRALPLPILQAYAAETPRGAHLVEAWDGAAGVAAMLFLRHGTGATYQTGWTSAAGRAANAHSLTLWAGMQVLRAAGATTLELGTVETQTNPGLARFKLGAGAAVRRLGGTWAAIPGL